MDVGHSLRTAGSRVLSVWPLAGVAASRRQRAVEGAIADGLPEVLWEPLRWLASGVTTGEVGEMQSRVEAARTLLPERMQAYASSALVPLGSVVSVSREWGTFLHLCAQSRQAKSVLELGVAGGISGSYLASAPSCRYFVGLEGALDRIEVAKRTFASCGLEAKVRLVPGNIDEMLPLEMQNDVTYDLVYIDAAHQMEPTLRALREMTRRMAPSAMLIFDDIRWSPEMYETWRRLCEWPGLAHAVDVGRMGAVVWQGGEGRPRVWELARELAWPKPVRVTTSLRPGQVRKA